MKTASIAPSALRAAAIGAACSALATGCFTSRTSLFGTYSNSGSPRTATSSSTSARPVSQVQPARVRAAAAQTAHPYTAAAPAAQQYRPVTLTTPHGTVLPQQPAATATQAKSSATTTAPAKSSATTTPSSDPGYRIYEVQPGDVAGRIANNNGMRLQEFCELNGITDPNKLRVGQKVKVATGRRALASGPAAATATASAAAAKSSTYRAPAASTAYHASASAEPAKRVTTGSTTTDIDALLRGGSLADQRTAAEEAAAKKKAEAAAAAEKARKEAEERAAALAQQKAEAEEAARREAEALKKSAAEQARLASEQAKAAAEQAKAAAAAAVPSVPAANSAGNGSYVVQDGDDLYSISIKYDTTPLELRRLNGGKSLTGLQPGDVIAVPSGN